MNLYGPEVSSAMRALNVGAPNRDIFVGVDLGQRENPSAIVAVERFDVMPCYTDMLRGKGSYARYVVRQAERIWLGTA